MALGCRMPCPAGFDLLCDELIAYLCQWLNYLDIACLRLTCKRMYRQLNNYLNVRRLHVAVLSVSLLPASTVLPVVGYAPDKLRLYLVQEDKTVRELPLLDVKLGGVERTAEGPVDYEYLDQNKCLTQWRTLVFGHTANATVSVRILTGSEPDLAIGHWFMSPGFLREHQLGAVARTRGQVVIHLEEGLIYEVKGYLCACTDLGALTDRREFTRAMLLPSTRRALRHHAAKLRLRATGAS